MGLWSKFQIMNNRPQLTPGAIVFLVCSALLFLGAIGLFIWLLVDAAEAHAVKNILYGAAFLAITVGIFVYSLCVTRWPRKSGIFMWTFIALGIATFIVGLCIN